MVANRKVYHETNFMRNNLECSSFKLQLIVRTEKKPSSHLSCGNLLFVRIEACAEACSAHPKACEPMNSFNVVLKIDKSASNSLCEFGIDGSVWYGLLFGRKLICCSINKISFSKLFASCIHMCFRPMKFEWCDIEMRFMDVRLTLDWLWAKTMRPPFSTVINFFLQDCLCQCLALCGGFYGISHDFSQMHCRFIHLVQACVLMCFDSSVVHSTRRP